MQGVATEDILARVRSELKAGSLAPSGVDSGAQDRQQEVGRPRPTCDTRMRMYAAMKNMDPQQVKIATHKITGQREAPDRPHEKHQLGGQT